MLILTGVEYVLLGGLYDPSKFKGGRWVTGVDLRARVNVYYYLGDYIVYKKPHVRIATKKNNEQLLRIMEYNCSE